MTVTPTPLTDAAELTAARAKRLRDHLDTAPYDAVVAFGAENVQYATGYRSSPGSHRRAARLAAVVTTDRTWLVGPQAEFAAALDTGVPATYVPYGTFYFESTTADHPAVRPADAYPDLAAAVGTVLGDAGLSGELVGVDQADLPREAMGLLHSERNTEHASAWFRAVRGRKLPAEVARLRTAARLAEAGVEAGIAAIRADVSERQLAAEVASVMTAGGATPRFVVVTAGQRSALSDAFPTDNQVRPGDLVRFDVGCTYDGYSSDVARTAVLGPPTATQLARYEALRLGEQAQLDLCRPGIAGKELFDAAVRVVEGNGLRPYRRHHCGHGIGMDTYEPPAVTADGDAVLEEGNVLCLETPFYELGWGGMMVEDEVVVTSTGCELLTHADRSLRVVS